MQTEKNITLKEQIIDWVKFGILLVIIYIGMTNSIGLTRVFGHSMDPTLRDGSLIAVNRLSAHFGEPKFGDVVIIREEDMGYDIIKRVIGLSGDTVAIKEGTVYVNGNPLPELYVLGESFDMTEITVAKGRVFIMGDNRTLGESLDSRDPSIGPVPIAMIKGYAMISIFPMYSIMKPLEL